MSEVAAWIETRCVDVPAELVVRVRHAVERTSGAAAGSGASVTRVLLDAALACMKSALGQGSKRAAAADLLAADALMTWACEAAIDGDETFDALAAEASHALAAHSSERRHER